MKNRVLKVITAISLIITLTMADFILFGTQLVAYALGEDGVIFNVCFKTEKGKVGNVAYEMNSNEMMLYLDIDVTSGYFANGVVSLQEDSNFKFKADNSNSLIAKIEEDKVYLEKLTTGVEIPLMIEPVTYENYREDMLSNKETVLTLSGEYNNGSDINTKVNIDKSVILGLTAPSNLDTILEANTITNKNYLMSEENKKIIQLELNSTVIDNLYPIKSTTFEIEMPKNVEKTEVITQGTYATDGNGERTLPYEIKDGILYVTIENLPKDGNISWKKNSKDNVIITFITTDETKEDKNYIVKSNVEIYGNESVNIEKQATYNLTEVKSQIIRATNKNSEEIYKGKLYSKENREYAVATNLEINYANLIEESALKEKTIYRTEKEDLVAKNIEYKTTTISKAEIVKILGNQGKLTIHNGSKQEVITAETETNDENGNIIITHEEGVTELYVTATKAVATGIIRLNHTKVIKADEILTEAYVDSLKYLVEQSIAQYAEEENIYESKTELKDVHSEVSLIVPERVAAEGNNEFEIKLNLKTDNEKYELYKNPEFLLQLPKGITIKDITSATILPDNDGLAVDSINIENERRIRIKLKGEQTKYLKSNINTQISFALKISVEKLMPNSVGTVKMAYKNNGIVYNIESSPINVIASNSRVVTHIKVENYNEQEKALEKYSNASKIVKGELPIENAEIIKVPVTYTIINNYDTDISVLEAIVAKHLDREKSEKYLLNSAEQNIKIEAGEMKVFNEEIEIPQGLYYSEIIDIQTLAEYSYGGTSYDIRNDLKLATETREGLRESTTVDQKIKIDTFAQLGDETAVNKDDSIYDEQIVKYTMEITNISEEVVSNIILTNTQTNGNIYDLEEVEVVNWHISGEKRIEHQYAELDTQTKSFEITTLKPGETKEIVCRVVAKKVEPYNITTANISISSDGIEARQIQTIANTVKTANLKVSSCRALKEEVQIFGNSSYLILNTIENLTNQRLENVEVQIHLSDGLSYREDYIIEANNEKLQTLDIIRDIEFNEKDRYVNLKISGLDPKQKIIISATFHIDKLPIQEESKEISVYLEANGIISNDVISYVKQSETALELEQTVDIEEGKKLKDNEEIVITAKITNVGAIDSEINIEDKLPTGLEIEKVIITQKGEETELETSNNYIFKIINLTKGETIYLKIESRVNTSKIVTETIENTIFVKPSAGKISSNTVTLTIESTIDDGIDEEVPEADRPKEEIEDDGTIEEPEIRDDTEYIKPEDSDEDDNADYQGPEDDNTDNPGGNPGEDSEGGSDENLDGDQGENEGGNGDQGENEGGNGDQGGDEGGDQDESENGNDGGSEGGDQGGDSDGDSDIEQTNIISGYVWIDRNEDKKRDDNEGISNVRIKVIDANDRNTFVKDKNGKEIEVKTDSKGKYTIEELENGNYNLIFIYDTKIYELAENENTEDYIIESTKEKVAITSKINLTKDQTIDLNLMELTEFNLKIDKYISKVIVQTANGTKTSEYTKKQLAREEIQSKYLSGATVLVEYTLEISNIGELAGYATELIDYLPEDMKFYSELNTQWHTGNDGNIYNTSLSATPINPGESKTVKLVLSKTMTKENTGVTSNLAEISQTMNDKGYEDIDLNNNQSKAEIIVNPATGRIIVYTLAIISSAAIIVIGVYIIKKEVIE